MNGAENYIPGLNRRIEDSKIRGRIRAATRHPLPAERVVRQIRIHQRVPEPGRAFLPADQQVLHQKRCHHHSHPVVHPTRTPQLAHARVHQRVARLAPLTGAGLRESHVHDVTITRESPNYPRRGVIFTCRHSGMVRRTRPQMRKLRIGESRELPGSMLRIAPE